MVGANGGGWVGSGGDVAVVPCCGGWSVCRIEYPGDQGVSTDLHLRSAQREQDEWGESVGVERAKGERACVGGVQRCATGKEESYRVDLCGAAFLHGFAVCSCFVFVQCFVFWGCVCEI